MTNILKYSRMLMIDIWQNSKMTFFLDVNLDVL